MYGDVDYRITPCFDKECGVFYFWVRLFKKHKTNLMNLKEKVLK